MAINWFPGHMQKAQREIRDMLPQIDVVIEVCDARLPFSSENPMIADIRGEKPLIKILNKSDLADADKTAHWLDYYAAQRNVKAIALTTDNKLADNLIPTLIKKLVPSKVDLGKHINAVIMGIPNVGKSTLINTLAGATKAKVGNEPAVTKDTTRIRLETGLYLTDTPGMLWPKFANEFSGYRLAVTGAIKDTAFSHEDIADFVAEYLLYAYPERVMARFQLDILPASADALIIAIAKQRGCMQRGGHIDRHKASEMLINDIRQKKLGAITFEMPDEVAKENAHFKALAAEKLAAREAKKLARGRGRKNKR